MKISVITVCRNAERTIVAALRSVVEQTHPDIEHLVIDGLSTDGTVDLVRANAERIARVISEQDGGIYEAMNKGIGLATGDFTCFLNADDMYASPAALATLVEALQASSADAVYADLHYVQRENPSRPVRRWTSQPFHRGLFATGWAPAHPTFLVRTEILRELGGFDTHYRLAADFDLMCRALEVRCITNVYVPNAIILMRGGGVTNRSLRNIVQQNREILASLRANGFTPNVAAFALRKITSRLRQYIQANNSRKGAA